MHILMILMINWWYNYIDTFYIIKQIARQSKKKLTFPLSPAEALLLAVVYIMLVFIKEFRFYFVAGCPGWCYFLCRMNLVWGWEGFWGTSVLADRSRRACGGSQWRCRRRSSSASRGRRGILVALCGRFRRQRSSAWSIQPLRSCWSWSSAQFVHSIPLSVPQYCALSWNWHPLAAVLG